MINVVAIKQAAGLRKEKGTHDGDGQMSERVSLIHKLVISVTVLVHSDMRALLSNWGFQLCMLF